MIKIEFATAKSVRGISHHKNGLPNQDSILIQKNGGHFVAAISDGHGSSNCFRSHKGSQFAVNVFSEQITKYINLFPKTIDLDAIKQFGTSLPTLLVDAWKKKVDEDILNYPFSAKENPDETQLDKYLPYGCTLVSCYISEYYGIFCQIGDGDQFAVFSNNETTLLVPEDSRLTGNATTSMCLTNANDDFRVVIMEFSKVYYPEVLILGTDGVGNSYRNNIDLFKWAEDIKVLLQKEGSDYIENNLGFWLDEVSSTGSADDISMAVIVLGIEPNAILENTDFETETILSDKNETGTMLKRLTQLLKIKKTNNHKNATL